MPIVQCPCCTLPVLYFLLLSIIPTWTICQGHWLSCLYIPFKVKKELLPCLRSFTSGLRVAEVYFGFSCSSRFIVWHFQVVWNMGMLIKSYPPEASTIKNIEDSWALLKTEDGQSRWLWWQFFEQLCVKVWGLSSRLDERHRRSSQRERAAPSRDRRLWTPGFLKVLTNKLRDLANISGHCCLQKPLLVKWSQSQK